MAQAEDRDLHRDGAVRSARAPARSPPERSRRRRGGRAAGRGVDLSCRLGPRGAGCGGCPDFAAHCSVFAGDVVAHKKPAPDIYLLALRELGTHAAEAVVIEDSRYGLLAAAGAGIGCLSTLSTYTQQENMTGAALVVSSLGDPGSNDVTVVANRTRTVPGNY